MTPTLLARGRFFVGVAAKSDRRWRDGNTLPLFSLPMLMDCEGLLAAEAREKILPSRVVEAPQGATNA